LRSKAAVSSCTCSISHAIAGRLVRPLQEGFRLSLPIGSIDAALAGQGIVLARTALVLATPVMNENVLEQIRGHANARSMSSRLKSTCAD